MFSRGREMVHWEGMGSVEWEKIRFISDFMALGNVYEMSQVNVL